MNSYTSGVTKGRVAAPPRPQPVAERPRAEVAPPKKPQKRVAATVSSVVRRVRVIAVNGPSTYYSTTLKHPAEFTNPVFVAFTGAEDGIRYSGTMPTRVDPFHMYTVVCADIMMGRGRGIATRRIIALQNQEPIVMTTQMLKVTAQTHADLRDVSIFNGMPFECKCGDVLRRFGESAWYKQLEAKFPCYFFRWYVDGLCLHSMGDVKYVTTDTGKQKRIDLPFGLRSMSAYSCATVFQLARIAATDPWRLCFWWLAEVSICRDMCAEGIGLIAEEFESTHIEKLYTKEMAMTYAGAPFGDASRDGHSFVPHATFSAVMTSPIARANMMKAGLVTPVCITDSVTQKSTTFFAPVGERMLENRLIEQIVDITTFPDTEIESNIVPRHRQWPWSDGLDGMLTDEQRDSIDQMLTHRMFVLTGSAGTGKTSYVIRSLQSAFKKGKCMLCATTCVAVDLLRQFNNNATTIAKIVDKFRRVEGNVMDPRYPFGGKVALIIEEASMVGIREFSELLDALGNTKWLRYIVMVGDPNQLKGMGNGPMPMRAIQKWLTGTILAPRLTRSMRASTVALSTSLESILTYNGTREVSPRVTPECPVAMIEEVYAPLGMKWSTDLDSDAPVVFVYHSGDMDRAVTLVRDALARSGVDPDSPNGSYRVLMHTNKQVQRFGNEWYRRAHPEAPDYRVCDFHVGERIMFTTNRKSEQPLGSVLTTSDTYNGQSGVLVKIVDEEINIADMAQSYADAYKKHMNELEAKRVRDAEQAGAVHVSSDNKPSSDDNNEEGGDGEPAAPPADPLANVRNHRITILTDTGAPMSYPSCLRWIVLDTGILTTYTPGCYINKSSQDDASPDDVIQNEVVHAEYTTISKSQGAEFQVVCVFLEGTQLEQRVLNRHAIYTACTRAKRRCIVAVPGPAGRTCPDRHLFSIIANTTLDDEATDLHLRFPPVNDYIQRTCISGVPVAHEMAVEQRQLAPATTPTPALSEDEEEYDVPPPIQDDMSNVSRVSLASSASLGSFSVRSNSSDTCKLLFGDDDGPCDTETPPKKPDEPSGPTSFKDMFKTTHKHHHKKHRHTHHSQSDTAPKSHHRRLHKTARANDMAQSGDVEEL